MSTVHEETNPYQCKICEKDFTASENLRYHMDALHGNGVLRPHKCAKCDAAFPTSSKLKRHFAVIHEGIKPYQCIPCDAKFAEKRRLNEHLAGKDRYKCDNGKGPLVSLEEINKFKINPKNGKIMKAKKDPKKAKSQIKKAKKIKSQNNKLESQNDDLEAQNDGPLPLNDSEFEVLNDSKIESPFHGFPLEPKIELNEFYVEEPIENHENFDIKKEALDYDMNQDYEPEDYEDYEESGDFEYTSDPIQDPEMDLVTPYEDQVIVKQEPEDYLETGEGNKIEL